MAGAPALAETLAMFTPEKKFMSDDVPVTAAAQQALETELSVLREEKQREIPARLRIAREFGDTANNDEYLAIREEEAVLATRIARLEDIVRRAIVIEHTNGNDSVEIGSRVAILDRGTGETVEYVIEGAHAAPGPGVVSARSPVGRALLGRRLGDRVSVIPPNGRRRELELRAIRAPLVALSPS